MQHSSPPAVRRAIAFALYVSTLAGCVGCNAGGLLIVEDGGGGRAPAWGDGLVACSDDNAPGAVCEACDTFPDVDGARLVECNYSTRAADCGGPSVSDPRGVTSDCRELACVCHACFFAAPTPCQAATYCGAGDVPCDAAHPCVEPAHTYPGVSGISCIGGACLWTPNDGSGCGA